MNFVKKRRPNTGSIALHCSTSQPNPYPSSQYGSGKHPASPRAMLLAQLQRNIKHRMPGPNQPISFLDSTNMRVGDGAPEQRGSIPQLPTPQFYARVFSQVFSRVRAHSYTRVPAVRVRNRENTRPWNRKNTRPWNLGVLSCIV